MSLFALGVSAKPDKDYLCFTALQENSTVQLKYGQGTPYNVSLQYSKDDGVNWYTYTIKEVITLNNIDDKVYFRKSDDGLAIGFSKGIYDYYLFVMKGLIAASGNIMSLIDNTCTSTIIPCDHCFSDLFFRCSSLVSAPKLPATTLTFNCYGGMFYECTNLTTAPDLPATTLAEVCYSNMFAGCTNLTTAPELPATTLVNNCYKQMFSQTKISSIKVGFTDWCDGAATNAWLSDITSNNATFYYPKELKISTRSTSYVPSGWTISPYNRTCKLQVTDVGWASIYLEQALEIPEYVKVYYANDINENIVSLSEIKDEIPANTAVIVKALKGIVEFPFATTNVIPMPENANYFKGLLTGMFFNDVKAIETNKNIYTLCEKDIDGNPIFKPYDGETLAAHKMYLPLASSAPEVKFRIAGDGDFADFIDAGSWRKASGKAISLEGLEVNGDSYSRPFIRNGKLLMNIKNR